MAEGVRPEEEEDGGLGDTAGLGDRGRLLGGAGEETRPLGLTLVLKKKRTRETSKDCYKRIFYNMTLTIFIILTLNDILSITAYLLTHITVN